MTEAATRADLEAFLVDRFGVGSPRIAEGVALLDNATLGSKIPNIALRAALASLLGTTGEPTVDEWLTNPLLGSITFADLASGEIGRSVGSPVVFVEINDTYQYESYLSFAGLLVHESLHTDTTNSYEEELANTAIQFVVHMEQLSVRPEIASVNTELSQFFNTLTLARLNSGSSDELRIFSSQGPLFPGAGIDDLDQFSEILTAEITGNPTAGTALLDVILVGLAESGNTWVPGGDFGDALDFLDLNHAGLEPAEILAAAQALELAVPKALSISIGDATAHEGDVGNPLSISFAVTLSRGWDEPITVDYVIVPGTATAPDDLQDRNGAVKTLKFNPSVRTGLTPTSKFITVSVAPDLADELDEGFSVVLSNPSGIWSLGRSTAQGFIADDDPGVGVGVGDASIVEGDSGTSNKVKVWLTLDAPALIPITVDYSVVGGTATTDVDFKQRPSKTVTFSPGQTKKAVTLTVYPDVVPEGDETILVTLTNAVGTSIADGSGTLTILDDD